MFLVEHHDLSEPAVTEIRPESLLAELKNAEVYEAENKLQVAQEQVVGFPDIQQRKFGFHAIPVIVQYSR